MNREQRKHKGSTMNHHCYLFALAAIGMLSGAPAVLSQGRSAGPSAPPGHLLEEAGFGHHLHQQLEHARRQLEQQIADVRQTTGDIARNAVAAARLHANLVLPGRTSQQALVIRTRDLDPEAHVQLEEDLNVMARILEKVTQDDTAPGPRAMGINLLLGQGASPVRSLYLDGYGALFVTTVPFPLLASLKSEKEPSEESMTDAPSAWEQTRRELYGSRQASDPGLGLGWVPEAAEGQAFDGARVEQLRQDLLEAMRHASNIRQLAGEDFVTLCVIGSPAVVDPHVRAPRRGSDYARGGDGSSAMERRGEAGDRERSVLILQFRKADLDEFARGAITREEFEARARTASYMGGGGWPAPLSFVWSHR
jgi:hypothetical protein